LFRHSDKESPWLNKCKRILVEHIQMGSQPRWSPHLELWWRAQHYSNTKTTLLWNQTELLHTTVDGRQKGVGTSVFFF
jgi:hypothetical protein